MKIETLAIVALATVLAFSGRGSGSGCGPGGCLLLPPDFAETANNAALPLRTMNSHRKPESTGTEIVKPERCSPALSF